MSDSIKAKIETLNSQRRDVEKQLEWYRGQKDGLHFYQVNLEAQLEDVRQRDKKLNEKIREQENAILVATAQIDFVKECAAIRKDELSDEESKPEQS